MTKDKLTTDHSLVHQDRSYVEDTLAKIQRTADDGYTMSALQRLLAKQKELISIGDGGTKNRIAGLIKRYQREQVEKYAAQAREHVRKGSLTEAINLLRSQISKYYFDDAPELKQQLTKLAENYEAQLPHN